MNTVPRPIKRPLGRILTDAGLVTEEKLAAALREQHRTNELLGAVLVRMGEIDPLDLDIALSLQKDLAAAEDAVRIACGIRKMLGEIFVHAGRITPEQLDAALAEQKKTGELLGQALVRLGLVTAQEAETALAFQRNQAKGAAPPSRLRLGELLVAGNFITRRQLNDALRRQRETRKLLGEVLVESGEADSRKVRWALRLQEMLMRAALIAALSLSPVPVAVALEAEAGSPGPRLAATVPGGPGLKLLRQPDQLIVTDADVRRGSLGVEAASLIELRNNGPAGCLVMFGASVLLFREATVKGLGSDFVLGPNGGMMTHMVKGTVTATLSYRFVFAEGAQPGTYAWPLSLSARTL